MIKHCKIKLKCTLALLTAIMLMVNTENQLGYATDNSSSTAENSNSTVGASDQWTPRFPVGRGGNLSGLAGNSGNSSGKKDDEDWVSHKDDDRHGITSSSSWSDVMANAGVKSGGHLGEASGTYAVKIGDKSYYWYHQSSQCPGCVYCGNWTNMQWGSGGTFGSDGCAICSLAIIVSNLTGQEITPSKLLTDMGCKINESGTKCDTSTSKYINDHSLALDGAGTGQFICDKYGLEMAPDLGSLSKADCQAKVNEVLDKGGMVWYRYSGGSWASYSTSSHFIPIRGYDEKGYYILDQCMSPDSSGNQNPISFDTLYNEFYGGSYFVGFWVSGAKSNNSSSSSSSSGNSSSSSSNSSSSNVDSTGNNSAYSMWAGPANQLKQYSNTVDLGNGFKLYDGLPWAAESTTFAIDLDTATIAVEQYVKKTSGDNVAKCKFEYMQDSSGNYSAIELLKSNNNRMTNQGGLSADGGKWSSKDGGLYTDRGGIQCIGVGVGPALTDWDYNADFGASKGSSINDLNRWAIDYGCRTDIYNAKSAIVLYEIDTKKLWYLPAACISGKGHAFPGGLVQTGNALATPGWNKSPCKLDSNGLPTAYDLYRAGEGYDWTHHQTGSIKDIMKLMNFSSSSTSGYTSWDVTYSIMECWNLPNCVDSKIIDSGDYVAVGWVHWPTEK